MASRQQIIHVITEIAVIVSITAYFLYKNKVLNEKMKSLEYKIYQQEEIIKKHDTILQTLLSSSISKSLEKNNVTFHKPEVKNPPDVDCESETDDENDTEDNQYDYEEQNVQILTDISSPNLKKASQGNVVISLGAIPLPNFGFESFLPVSNDIPNSSKVEDVTNDTEECGKDILQNEVDDEEELVKDDNSQKKKKKKKNKKKKNLTDDELLDIELEKEIQELA